MLYRKKPVIVQAEQWFPQPPPIDKRPRRPERLGVSFCPPIRSDLTQSRGIIINRPERYVVNTLDGPVDVRPGDWIVIGVKGERYPVRADIFELTYEPFTPDVAERVLWGRILKRLRER